MANESRMVVLHYSKDKRETIKNIINMESVVALQVVNRGLDIKKSIGESALEATLPTRQNSEIEQGLHHIGTALRDVDCEKDIDVTERLLLVRDELQSLRDDCVTKEGVQIPNVQHQTLEKYNGVIEKVKPVAIIEHRRKEDFRTRISQLTDANQKLSCANNELIIEVDEKESELSAVKDELRRMRDNESQLKIVEENLEASRNTTDKAPRVLSSLKEKDRTYRDGFLKLKDELKACRAERKEIIKDLERQNEAWEKKHAELVNRNEYLQGKIAGFKRKLGDVMENIDNGTPSKKR